MILSYAMSSALDNILKRVCLLGYHLPPAVGQMDAISASDDDIAKLPINEMQLHRYQ